MLRASKLSTKAYSPQGSVKGRPNRWILEDADHAGALRFEGDAAGGGRAKDWPSRRGSLGLARQQRLRSD